MKKLGNTAQWLIAIMWSWGGASHPKEHLAQKKRKETWHLTFGVLPIARRRPHTTWDDNITRGDGTPVRSGDGGNVRGQGWG